MLIFSVTSHSNLIFRGPREETFTQQSFQPILDVYNYTQQKAAWSKGVQMTNWLNVKRRGWLWSHFANLKKYDRIFLNNNVFQNPNETASADVWKGKKWMRLTWHHFWCVWKAALEKPGSSDDIAKWICLLYPTNTPSSYLTCFLGNNLFFGPTYTFCVRQQRRRGIKGWIWCPTRWSFIFPDNFKTHFNSCLL